MHNQCIWYTFWMKKNYFLTNRKYGKYAIYQRFATFIYAFMHVLCNAYTLHTGVYSRCKKTLQIARMPCIVGK